MVLQNWVLLTVTTSIVLAAAAIYVYSRIEFQTFRVERSLIKTGILLLPLYGLLEFGALPESDLPVIVLFLLGISLVYAFHLFQQTAAEEPDGGEDQTTLEKPVAGEEAE